MKLFKIIAILMILLTSLTKCKSAKLENSSPLATQKAYFQTWIAGIREGGSGINVFIPISSELKNIKPDSLYFRSQKVVLTTKPNNPKLYIGRVATIGNQKKGFKLQTTSVPFDLKENDAVITYIENGSTKYFKIENIPEKQAQHYPSAPPSN